MFVLEYQYRSDGRKQFITVVRTVSEHLVQKGGNMAEQKSVHDIFMTSVIHMNTDYPKNGPLQDNNVSFTNMMSDFLRDQERHVGRTRSVTISQILIDLLRYQAERV